MTKEIKVNVAARKPLTKEQIDTSAVLKSMILTSMLCAEFGYIELINCGVLKRQDKNLARKEAKLIRNKIITLRNQAKLPRSMWATLEDDFYDKIALVQQMHNACTQLPASQVDFMANGFDQLVDIAIKRHNAGVKDEENLERDLQKLKNKV